MIGEFYDVVDSLKDRAEVRLFLKDLFSADEIAAFMRRIEIAVLLDAKYSYRKIYEILGVGTDKISRVHKCLQQDDSGYKIIAKRLIENRKKHLRKIKKEEKDVMSPNSLVKKKYAGIFLLDNLLDSAINKLEENDEELKKEALLFTPSSTFTKKEK